MTEYTALLALPDGDRAREAAARLPWWAQRVCVQDNPSAGVWLSWAVEADSDEIAVTTIQEARMRAEMSPGNPDSLFQSTPFIILKGAVTVIHSEEVHCI